MSNIYRFGRFNLDKNVLELQRDDQPIELRRQAYDTLAYLVENSDRVVTKQEFFDQVWQGRLVTENSLSQSIADIRRALGDDGRRLIRTVHGRGFKFEGKLEREVHVFPEAWQSTRPISLSEARAFAPAAERVENAPLETVPLRSSPQSERNAVTVLPFSSLTQSPAEVRFGHGVSEDLIRCLSGWRLFPVISGGSSWSFVGREPSGDPGAIGEELGASYVVDGSIDTAGSRVRARVRLSRVAGRQVLWSERYDEPLDDFFLLQDEIAERIASQLLPELVRAEIDCIERRPPSVLDAWQTTLIGLGRYHRGHLDERTAEYFESARSQDPGFVLPNFLLGYLRHLRVHHQCTNSVEDDLIRVAEAAQTCLRIDSRDPCGYLLDGLVSMVRGEGSLALQRMEQAVELNPSMADARSLFAQLLAMRGRGEEGVRQARLALRLSPRDPRRSSFLSALAIGHFVAHRYDEAARCAERAALERPDLTPNYLCIASCAGLMGETERGTWALQRVHQLHPSYSAPELDRLLVSTLPEIRERFWEGLSKSGLTRG